MDAEKENPQGTTGNFLQCYWVIKNAYNFPTFSQPHSQSTFYIPDINVNLELPAAQVFLEFTKRNNIHRGKSNLFLWINVTAGSSDIQKAVNDFK